MDKSYLKKTGDDLQQYLAIMRRGSKINGKKGKGSYKRHSKYGKKEW